MKYSYDPPSLVKSVFPSFIWNTSNDKILFTFDDGPNAGNTEKILNELTRNKIKALFFCVGNNILKEKQLTKYIIEQGHTIGNHTLNHKRITKLNSEGKNNEIDKFSSIMLNEFNYRIEFFRPPYGRFNLSTSGYLTKINLRNVMWSLLTYDYRNNIDIVKFAVKKYLRKNSIIVLHDNPKCSNIITESIRYIIDEADKRGFQFGEPSECLK